MRLLTIIGLLALMLTSNVSTAQDIHFTQYYSAPVFLNPAFTGAGVCSRVSLSFRSQWNGVPNGYQSTLFAIDHLFHRQNVGLGLLIENDVAGTGNLRRTVVSPLLGYEVRLSRKLTLRSGFKPSVGTVSVNFNDLLFGDQIARGGNVTTIENPTQTNTYVDFGAGLLLYSNDFWLGTSFNHLVTPLDGLLVDEDSKLPMQYSLHGGYKLKINEDVRSVSNTESIFFSFNYRGQKEFDQLDLGAYYQKSVFTFGFWYRGLPGVKAYAPGYGNNDAVAIIVGIKTVRFQIGYSYDFTISQLTNASGGAHEVTLSAQLCNPKKRRRKPKSFTPCPSF